MIDRKFEHWLINYKGLSNKKADSIMRQLYETDGYLLINEFNTVSLFDSPNFVSFAKLRQSVNSRNIKIKAGKESIELLAEFYQLTESASFPFPDSFESPIIDYCNSIKAKNSLKVVLLIKLISCGASYHVCAVNEIFESFKDFYNKRLQTGLVAEQEKNFFSTPVMNDEIGLSIMNELPMKELVDEGIILCDSEYTKVIFSTKYRVHDDESEEILDKCNSYLEDYYKKFNPPKVNEIRTKIIDKIDSIANDFKDILECPEKESALNILKELSAAVIKIPDNTFLGQEVRENNDVENVEQIIDTEQVNSNGVVVDNGKSDDNLKSKYALKLTDNRLIGDLVRQSFRLLQSIDFTFSNQQISDLCSLDWSKKNLKLSYSCIRPLDMNINLRKLCKDHSGRARYWVERFKFGNFECVITSQWYKESKPYFIKWFNSILPDDTKLLDQQKTEYEEMNETEDTIIYDIPCEQIENVLEVLNTVATKKSVFTKYDEDNCRTEILTPLFIFPELHCSLRNGIIWEDGKETDDEIILVYTEESSEVLKFDRVLNLNLMEYISRYGGIATKFNLDLNSAIEPTKFEEAFMNSLTSKLL